MTPESTLKAARRMYPWLRFWTEERDLIVGRYLSYWLYVGYVRPSLQSFIEDFSLEEGAYIRISMVYNQAGTKETVKTLVRRFLRCRRGGQKEMPSVNAEYGH